MLNEPVTITSGTTTLGNGVALAVNAPIIVSAGAELVLNIPSIAAASGTSQIVILAGGTLTIGGKSITVLEDTIYDLDPNAL